MDVATSIFEAAYTYSAVSVEAAAFLLVFTGVRRLSQAVLYVFVS